MTSEFTQDEILKDYLKLDNRDDLFNSDILILPFDGKNHFKPTQPLDIKTGYEDLKIKYYVHDQNKMGYSFCASNSNLIDIGVAVISTISGLITIAKFIYTKYGNNPNSEINFTIFNKTNNNTYKYYDYKGDVNNFFNHEIEKMKDDF